MYLCTSMIQNVYFLHGQQFLFNRVLSQIVAQGSIFKSKIIMDVGSSRAVLFVSHYVFKNKVFRER